MNFNKPIRPLMSLIVFVFEPILAKKFLLVINVSASSKGLSGSNFQSFNQLG